MNIASRGREGGGAEETPAERGASAAEYEDYLTVVEGPVAVDSIEDPAMESPLSPSKGGEEQPATVEGRKDFADRVALPGLSPENWSAV